MNSRPGMIYKIDYDIQMDLEAKKKKHMEKAVQEFIQVNVKVAIDESTTIWDCDKYNIEEGDDVASILERMAEFLDKEAYGGGNEMLEKLLEEDFGLVADKPQNHKPKAGEHIQFNMEKPIKKKDAEQNKEDFNKT